MHKRHPQCGCDCRHDGEGTELPRVCCAECDPRGPVAWFVYVPCDVMCGDDCLLGAGGGRRTCVPAGTCDPIYVYGFPLVPICQFDECRWLAIWTVKDSCPGQFPNVLSTLEPEAEYSIPACGEWGQLLNYPDDFAWELSIGGGSMSMTWNHPTYGVLQYASTDPVECNGNNTLVLVSSGTATCLPGHLCVYPMVDYPCCCEDGTSGCFAVDPCYDAEENRCLCCDKCCECIPGTINLACGGTTYSCSDQFCVGGRTGVDSPSGVSREMCCTFTIGGGAPVEICVVIYCSSGTWKADWYCDGSLDGTVDLSSTCCPLSGSGNAPELSCVDCSGCVSFGAADDCVPQAACCCPDDPWPSTISVTLTDISGCACMGSSWTLTKTAGPDGTAVWEDTQTICGQTATLSVACVEISENVCDTIARIVVDGDATADVLATVAGTCSPLDYSGTFESSQDLGGWAGYCGSSPWSVGISITV